MKSILKTAVLIVIVLIPATGLLAWDYNQDLFRTKYTEQEIAEKRAEASRVAITRWADPDTRPITYEEWSAGRAEPGPLEIDKVADPDKSRAADFIVIVNSGLYPQIQSDIDLYVADLSNDGFSPEVYTATQGTPEELRDFLYTNYVDGIEGAFLIGDLPIPWYETFECWDPGVNEQFPCDYFYMDLDGTFIDNDSDGLYDGHTGNIMPEIYIGRLTASPMTFYGADEVSLIRNYFRKNRMYRHGEYRPNYRGLMFVDDDWVYSADQWNSDLQAIYCSTVKEDVEDETIDQLYEDHIFEGFEFVQVCVHSSPAGHYFNAGFGSGGVTTNAEIKSLDGKGWFYNLFACSNCRYVENDYMGGWYIFSQDHGLCAIGSTKTGSMLYFDLFYSPMGLGASIGEGFRDWFATIASWGMPFDDVCWFYGMTLLGDPTMHPNLERPPLKFGEPNIRHSTPYSSYWGSLTATGGGGTPPYNFELLSGSVPTGTAFNPETGSIMGIANEVGDFIFTVGIHDQCSPQMTDTETYMISIIDVCGDVNRDMAIDILDIIDLIDYKFKEGPAPELLGACDVNSDKDINILDIIYMIDYKFKDGPGPYCFN